MRAQRRVVVLLCAAATLAGCASGGTPREQSTGTLVTREMLSRYPGQPLARILERHVPGVVLTNTTDGSYALRIRPGISFTGDAFPLYILDGTMLPTGPEGAIPLLDPANLESVRVLKSTEASAYGIDGANGVIIITTRKGPAG